MRHVGEHFCHLPCTVRWQESCCLRQRVSQLRILYSNAPTPLHLEGRPRPPMPSSRTRCSIGAQKSSLPGGESFLCTGLAKKGGKRLAAQAGSVSSPSLASEQKVCSQPASLYVFHRRVAPLSHCSSLVTRAPSCIPVLPFSRRRRRRALRSSLGAFLLRPRASTKGPQS